MSSSNQNINQVPFLRTSWQFPEEIEQLSVELDRSFLDVANSVNSRIIGIFPVNRPTITGESYYYTTARSQSLRRVYRFTNLNSIDHGITITSNLVFTRMYGAFYDGTNWYPLCYPDFVNVSNSLSFLVSSTQIVFKPGNPGLPPPVTNGIIVLEWTP